MLNNGLRYTDFSRTICDVVANESILDMQGVIEAINHYYNKNGEKFDEIMVSPEYQKKDLKSLLKKQYHITRYIINNVQ